MNQTPCPHEPDVVRAARGRTLAGDLLAHAEACEDCRAALRVAGALRELAAGSRPQGPLPTAGQLWWRAEVVRRLVGNPGEREVQPAVWGEVVGVVLAVLVLLFFFSFQASSLLDLLAGREDPGGVLLKMALSLLPLAAVSLVGFLLARRA